jgi:hypothetical protein
MSSKRKTTRESFIQKTAEGQKGVSIKDPARADSHEGEANRKGSNEDKGRKAKEED